MARTFSSTKLTLFAFFTATILVGSVVLSLPGMWGGEVPLRYIDALFTSASAICVTGLITVDTAQYTRLGQLVIMLLIQVGGLGIISFTTLLIAAPRRRLSLRSIHIIREYYIDSVEYDTKNIVRNIVVTTLAIELFGAVLLFLGFRTAGVPAPLFTSVFHAVSAFCNAGFSTFSTGLAGFARLPFVPIVVALLVVFGGLGFVVLQDLGRRARGVSRELRLHTRVVVATTLSLIVVGWGAYLALEWTNVFSPLDTGDKIVAGFFQSITTRTAGFNTIDEAAMRPVSKFFTIALMFVGAAPGSTGGGIKVTALAIIVLAAARGVDDEGRVTLANRSLGAATITRTHMFAAKAVGLLFTAVFLLLLVESGNYGPHESFLSLLFESVSAFATVGLSLGATPELTDAGKLIIIATMFAGRVGLVSFALPKLVRTAANVHYVEGEVMLG